ncbi:uncharacterized protein LY89DRAFT_666129 [Mollisia scopiformis]|uniref:Uncharacterized protein n=1 Tax=Mollisia scopiformis TaxID=149040 RepID=A0A194XL07_MOLSC|nr:uncharacterized protein LY89DRAFT_666129 [Mollisia scopiformis]KUJ20457.1 hypothetical protein LY89DRAFT_666129 [Mollisia scopiformis]
MTEKCLGRLGVEAFKAGKLIRNAGETKYRLFPDVCLPPLQTQLGIYPKITNLASANNLQVSLNFLKEDPLYKTVRHYEVWLDDKIPAGLPKTNVKFELYHNIPIIDARADGLDTFSIEEQGFEFLFQKFPRQFEISGSDAANSSPEQRQSILGYLDLMADFLCGSPNGIKKSLSYLLTEEEKADIVEVRYRLRVINLWRPLEPVVENQPLAFCDRRSVQTSDWEEWFWLSNQTMDEVTAIVVLDSADPDSLTANVPPCSLKLPVEDSSAKLRESIEIKIRFVYVGTSLL